MKQGRRIFGALLLPILGCWGDQGIRPPAHGSTPSSPGHSVTVSSANPEQVQPSALPPAIRAACHSAIAIVREVLKLDLSRVDGRFADSFQGTLRLGCRITGTGSFAALGNSAGPVETIDAAFTRRGWKSDLRYMADGPDGSDVGLRQGDMLCLVMGRWSGHDDEDTTTRATREEEDRYDLIVECARDAA